MEGTLTDLKDENQKKPTWRQNFDGPTVSEMLTDIVTYSKWFISFKDHAKQDLPQNSVLSKIETAKRDLLVKYLLHVEQKEDIDVKYTESRERDSKVNENSPPFLDSFSSLEDEISCHTEEEGSRKSVAETKNNYKAYRKIASAINETEQEIEREQEIKQVIDEIIKKVIKQEKEQKIEQVINRVIKLVIEKVIEQEINGQEIGQETDGQVIEQEIDGQEIEQEIIGQEIEQEIYGQEIEQEIDGQEIEQEIYGQEIEQEIDGQEIEQEKDGQETEQEINGQESKQEINGQEIEQKIKLVIKLVLILVKKVIKEQETEEEKEQEINGQEIKVQDINSYIGLLQKEVFVEELHKILMDGVIDKGLTKPGQYSTKSRRTSHRGKDHEYPQFENESAAEETIQYLIDEYNSMIQNIKKAEVSDEERLRMSFKCASSFLFTFLQLHPFADGNGRLARLLASYSMLTFSPFMTPIYNVFSKSSEQDYIDALVEARQNLKQSHPAILDRNSGVNLVIDLLQQEPRDLFAMIIESNWTMWRQFLIRLGNENIVLFSWESAQSTHPRQTVSETIVQNPV